MPEITLYIRDRGQQGSVGRSLDSDKAPYQIGRASPMIDISLHSPYVSRHHGDILYSDRWQFLNLGQNRTWLERDGSDRDIARGETIDLLEGDIIWISDRQSALQFTYNSGSTLEIEREANQTVTKPDSPSKRQGPGIDGIDTLWETVAYAVLLTTELPLLKLLAIAVVVSGAIILLRCLELPQRQHEPPIDQGASMLMLKHQSPTPIVFNDFDHPYELPEPKLLPKLKPESEAQE